jgi:hypothetical protein
LTVEVRPRETTFTVRLKYMDREGQPLGPPVDARVAAEELALLWRQLEDEHEHEHIEARARNGRSLAAGNYSTMLQMVRDILEEDCDDCSDSDQRQ